MRSRIAYLVFIAVLGVLAYFGVQADYKSFVGSLFAAFLSAFIVFFVEQEMILLLDLSVTRDAVDIGSGAGEILDIVMRAPGEEGCRGWHNRMIQNPNPRHEDRFELRMGRYHA